MSCDEVLLGPKRPKNYAIRNILIFLVGGGDFGLWFASRSAIKAKCRSTGNLVQALNYAYFGLLQMTHTFPGGLQCGHRKVVAHVVGHEAKARSKLLSHLFFGAKDILLCATLKPGVDHRVECPFVGLPIA